jgi:hypothetical protein
MKLRLAAASLLLLLPSIPVHAQGCAQCRDNAAATPPQTQTAYRHAIELMVIAAGSIFLTGIVLLKKQR